LNQSIHLFQREKAAESPFGGDMNGFIVTVLEALPTKSVDGRPFFVYSKKFDHRIPSRLCRDLEAGAR
jgi:hypothetical protein